MSNEAKWTPGPWEFYADDEVISRACMIKNLYPTVVVPDSGTFYDGYDDELLPPKESITANAHLIAAAPELYEALHTLYDLHCRARLGSDAHIKEFQVAHDALAKARGKP